MNLLELQYELPDDYRIEDLPVINTNLRWQLYYEGQAVGEQQHESYQSLMTSGIMSAVTLKRIREEKVVKLIEENRFKLPRDSRPIPTISHTDPKVETPSRVALAGKGTENRLHIERKLTNDKVRPENLMAWGERTAEIKDHEGKTIFKQTGIDAPEEWSDQAVNIVAQKYFRGHPGTPEREDSVLKMVYRIVDPIYDWGIKDRYFYSDQGNVFRDELAHIILNQMATFNSPVWFNMGRSEKPQCSACFILAIEDHMGSILNWYREEGLIFKDGSGSGVNLSNLRSKLEQCSDHGHASGPVSFMKCADASAGVIKSGGKTRRAAKMVVLNADHPDIFDFIDCKMKEGIKARALESLGYSGGIDGEAAGSVFFQNANNSVRVTDEFMEKLGETEDAWYLTPRVDKNLDDISVSADDLFHRIAEAAWACGDPGLQFDTTINAWHTCPNSGRINASNPCSEYMHLDNSACNLASINLMKFVSEKEGKVYFDIDKFQHVVRIMITAQDILVDNASYPTPEIEKTTRAFRQLGLGYANLGSLIMYYGLPYDSDAGRDLCAGITALMTGTAYHQSGRIADIMGPFQGFEKNKQPMLEVIQKHLDAAGELSSSQSETTLNSGSIWAHACASWETALYLGRRVGFRNSQTTVLAPTGTIAFMMDCDTTGIEPAIGLIAYKQLAGGGQLKLIHNGLPEVLRRLGFQPDAAKAALDYLEENGTFEGYVTDEDTLAIFDTAFKSKKATRNISPEGHVRMMAAAQPFLSGAISKTINMPTEAAVEDVEQVYKLAWELGLKSIAVYRDGCKSVQPLSLDQLEKSPVAESVGTNGALHAKNDALNGSVEAPRPYRRKLPIDCQSERHRFEIAGHKGYIIVGLYPDGTPGELFVSINKQGSTVSGLMDSWATAISYALQYGTPLEFIVRKFSHRRFEPSGWTANPQIKQASSIIDYIARYLGYKFLQGPPVSDNGAEAVAGPGIESDSALDFKLKLMATSDFVHVEGKTIIVSVHDGDENTCQNCGMIMVRVASCFRCLNCGADTGCG